jgi:hypothetical protein
MTDQPPEDREEPDVRRDDPDAPGNYVDDDTDEVPEPNEPG